MPRNARVLRFEFASPEHFLAEYQSNISNGGIFIATDEPLAVRQRVTVQIALTYCQKRISLAGEVVHRVSAELAAGGATPGVAVQLSVPVGKIRESLAAFVPDSPAPEPSPGAGRRHAPRTQARLRARVQVDGRSGALEDADVRTRNLSTAGVLISSGSEPIPVGQAVSLVLSQPGGGRELAVQGTVVRHIEAADGRVAAFGVAFHVSAENGGKIAGFVEQVRALAHSRRLGVIAGPIEEVGLEALMRSFAACAPRGTLAVQSEVEEGAISFEDGALHGATLGGATGAKALARMLTWPEGLFEFRPEIDDAAAPQPSMPLDEVLAQARRLAAPDADGGLPPSVRRSRLALSGGAAAFEPGDKTEQAVLDLAAVGMSVGKVYDVIPESDAAISRVLRDLVEQDVLSFVD